MYEATDSGCACAGREFRRLKPSERRDGIRSYEEELPEELSPNPQEQHYGAR